MSWTNELREPQPRIIATWNLSFSRLCSAKTRQNWDTHKPSTLKYKEKILSAVSVLAILSNVFCSTPFWLYNMTICRQRHLSVNITTGVKYLWNCSFILSHTYCCPDYWYLTTPFQLHGLYPIEEDDARGIGNYFMQYFHPCVVSVFRCGVNEESALLGFYAA